MLQFCLGQYLFFGKLCHSDSLPLLLRELEQGYSAGAACLASIRSLQNRIATVDLLGNRIIVAVQFVDDTAAPASSLAQSSCIWASCEKYTWKHGPRFNLGVSTSAILVVFEIDPNDNSIPMYCTLVKLCVLSLSTFIWESVSRRGCNSIIFWTSC